MLFLKILLIVVAVALALLLTLIAVSACMLSSRISREEEKQELERLQREASQDSE